MSLQLLERVAFRQLPERLKVVLIVMATYGRPDGTGIRAAMRTLAAWLCRSERRTRAAVADLRRQGLVAVTMGHGPHRPTEYRIVLAAVDALPLVVMLPRGTTQLNLFSANLRANLTVPQAIVAECSRKSPFPQASTGVHRTIAAFKADSGVRRSE